MNISWERVGAEYNLTGAGLKKQSHADLYYRPGTTMGTPVYPLAAPPSKALRKEKLASRFLAEKGAVHDLVSSSCASGKNKTRVGQ